MPNTIGNWKRIATIIDDERLKRWESVFPGGVVPIVEPVARKVNVPGHQSVDAYMLDLAALSEIEIHGVIRIISETFNIPSSEVRDELHLGVSILAEGVRVTVFDMDYFAGMDLDDVFDEFHYQEE